MNNELQREILAVLTKHNLCVISTVDAQSKPEAAIVGFSQSDDLHLLIGTSNQTRKFANLQQNPQVAIALGDYDSEVQYEGTVRQLDKDELDEHLKSHFKKLPGTAKYLENPSQVWLLVTPTWIRFTVHGDEDRIEEVNFQ